MNTQFSNRKIRRRRKGGIILALGLLAVPLAANSGSAYIVGALGNFDAANFEGQDAYGFDVQLEGIQAGDLMPSWTGNKFGSPNVVPYATGVNVRYQSTYDSTALHFVSATVPKAPGTAFAGTCYMGSPAYFQAGCDHFGVHLAYTAIGKATAVTYRWLLADPANPGQLLGSPNTVVVATPNYYFLPPPVSQPTAPPVLVAEIQLPPPPPPPQPEPVPQYGDATWMKVFKTELDREVALTELTSDNPIVPQNPAQIETDWVLLQNSPPPDGKHRQRGRHVNQGSPNSGTRSVIRRYETYAYTGAYDPLTHEVVCGGDGSCIAPLNGELGDMLSAQMTAANIAVPAITVTTSGNGSVASSDKLINCGKACTSTYALGTEVTLIASPASGYVFTGWQGACQGLGLTCTLTASDQLAVTATFGQQFTVSVGRSNTGTVTASPSGNDRALNCGNACSAKFTQGTLVTLTATPPAGKQFLGWSGACTGSGQICSMTVTKDLSAQAGFSK